MKKLLTFDSPNVSFNTLELAARMTKGNTLANFQTDAKGHLQRLSCTYNITGLLEVV